MGAGHAHPLYRAGNSPVHLMAPQVKIVAAFLFVCCVVATPPRAFWAFGAYLAVLLAIWAFARIPVGWFAKRALLEAPFIVLVVLLPFSQGGQRVDLLGMSMSEPGLLAAWNILAKGTLGVLTSLTLAGSTPMRDLVLGLQRLRAPSVVITIVTLMLRYVGVIVGEARRMRLARISRGHDPRLITQAGATARTVGSLFVRAYERGERVHLAMLARGWNGTMPGLHEVRTGSGQWLAGCAVAGVSGCVVVAAWLTR